MKKFLLAISASLCLGIAYAQNVGIGVINPLHAKLHVATTGTISQALFGDLGTGGISLDNNEPLVGFNLYTNSGRKYMSNGWGSILYFERTTGKLRYNVSNASGLTDAGVASFEPAIAIQADGNMGIGTSTPTEAKLQVHSDAGGTQFIAAAGSNLPGISAFYPSTSPTLGFNVRYQSGYKYMGAGYAGMWQFSPSSGRLIYYYTSTLGSADGSATMIASVALDSNGRFGVGTTSPKAPLHVTGNVVLGGASLEPVAGYKVSIDGKVICEEMKVQLSSAWPDYVFSENYKLNSLASLESFIRKNKHLPGIPSASEVEKNGFEVGDMNKRLLEKVEELSLYIIELDKQNKTLQNKVEDMDKVIKTLQLK